MSWWWQMSQISVMFWGCICYQGLGTLVPIDGNIDSRKYVNLLDGNLWPVVCNNFAERQFIFQDDNAPVHRSLLTRLWKNKRCISSFTWPTQ